ncbi:hypothetical protein [Microcystis phage MaeS]|nr:hypothetical protein [Microcystis phage MaeS]
MVKQMRVYYTNDEVENYEVNFEAFDLESVVSPVLNALVFEDENEDIQYVISMDRVRKVEFRDCDQGGDRTDS